MIELLNSKRMIIVIVLLFICSIVIPIPQVERARYTNHQTKQFLSFWSLTGFSGGIFGLLVKCKQNQLRCRLLTRLRRESSFDWYNKNYAIAEPTPTLIDIP